MIKNFTKNILNKIINEISIKENKEKINNEIIKPILLTFSEKIYPYVSLLFILYCVNLIIIITILILIITK
jgi:hypothetical protein